MTSILFRINGFDGSMSPSQMEYSWDEMGGTLGRGSSNDWVLPDEKRHLSGRHAIVKFQNGGFYVTDTSTNGLFLNGSSVPLGKDNTARLKHGDILKLGGYAIEVVASDEYVEPPLTEPEVVPDVALLKRPRPGGRRTECNDPFNGFTLDEEGTPPVSQKQGLPDWEGATTPVKEMSSHSQSDPFFSDGEFNADFEEKDFFQERQQDHSAIDGRALGISNFFAPADIPDSAPQSEKTLESHDLLAKPFKRDIETEGEVLLPDGFLSESEVVMDDDPFDFSGIGECVEAEDEGVDRLNVLDVYDIDTQIKPTEKEKEQKDESSAAVEANLPGQNQKDFLQGLGINNDQVNQEIAEHLDMKNVGVLFRILLQGSMEVLRTRTEIKNEMRMDVTTIQAIQNNPVKFSIDVEDALLRLLVPQKQAFMPPEQALLETYDDIKAHQVAVIAGVQASLKHVLERFEPEKLVDRLQKRNPIIANIPIQRQAKLWSLFEELYSTIEGEAQDDFQRLFGLEFARAYEQLIAQLESARAMK